MSSQRFGEIKQVRPIPIDQSLFQFWQALFLDADEEGMCHGGAHCYIALSQFREKLLERQKNMLWGIPHPDGSAKIIDEEFLLALTNELQLPIKEIKDYCHEAMAKPCKIPKTSAAQSSKEKQLVDWKSLEKLLGFDRLIPQTYNHTIIYTSGDGQLLPCVVIPSSHQLSERDLLRQIYLAKAIRAFYCIKVKEEYILQVNKGANLKEELKRFYTKYALGLEQVNKRIEEFDHKYPFILHLASHFTYLCQIMIYQCPENYPEVFSRTVYQRDFMTIHELLYNDLPDAPVQLMKQTPKIYSYSQLNLFFQSLEFAIQNFKKTSDSKGEGGDLPLRLFLRGRHVHSIAIVYNIEAEKWIILNDNGRNEVNSSDIAKHVLCCFTFGEDKIYNYSKFRCEIVFNELDKKFYVIDAIVDKEASADEKDSVARCKIPTLVSDITTTNLFLELSVFTSTKHQPLMQKLVNSWCESPKYQSIYEWSVANAIRLDCFFSMEEALEEKTALYLQGIRPEVLRLESRDDIQTFLAKEGDKLIEELQKISIFQLANILTSFPNKKFWLAHTKFWITLRIKQRIDITYSDGITLLKSYLEDDFYVELFRLLSFRIKNPVTQAAFEGRLDLLQYFLEELRFSPKGAPHFAAMSGSLDILKYLRSTTNLNLDEKNSDASPLSYAVAKNQLACVKWLVEECKANLHQLDVEGETPLTRAIKMHNRDATSRAIADYLFWHEIEKISKLPPAQFDTLFWYGITKLSELSPAQFDTFLDGKGKALDKAIEEYLKQPQGLEKILLKITNQNIKNLFLARFVKILDVDFVEYRLDYDQASLGITFGKQQGLFAVTMSYGNPNVLHPTSAPACRS